MQFLSRILFVRCKQPDKINLDVACLRTYTDLPPPFFRVANSFFFSSLPNNIRTPFLSHPDLMHPPSIDIDPVPDAEGLFCGILILGVRDGEFSPKDKVGGQATVRVRGVMGIS